VRDFRIIKQNGQRLFISYPQVSWRDGETGEIRYKSVLTIPPEQKQAIDQQRELRQRLLLLDLKRSLEKQIGKEFDQGLSARIDAVIFLLERKR